MFQRTTVPLLARNQQQTSLSILEREAEQRGDGLPLDGAGLGERDGVPDLVTLVIGREVHAYEDSVALRLPGLLCH